MAVHLIFCRIIAEVVRPLPPLVALPQRRRCSLANLPRPLPAASVASTKGAARALCLTFCKISPPPTPPPSPFSYTAITSVSSSFCSCSVYSLPPPPPPPPPLFNSSLSRLSYGVLPCTLECAGVDVSRAIARRRISNMIGARASERASELSIFSLSFCFPSSYLSLGRVAALSQIPRVERKAAARNRLLENCACVTRRAPGDDSSSGHIVELPLAR